MPLRLTTVRGSGGLVSALVEETASWREPPAGSGTFPGGWALLPSRPLAHVVQDALASRLPGALNVRLASLDQLARFLGAPRADARPVPRGRWEAFLRDHLRGSRENPLRPALEIDGLQDALFGTVHDLRMTGADTFGTRLLRARPPVFDNPPKISAVRNLFNAWTRLLEDEGLADRATYYRAALAGSDDGADLPRRLQADRVLAVLPPFLHGLQERLLLHLAQSPLAVDLWVPDIPGVGLPALDRTVERLEEAAGGVRAIEIPSLSGLDPFTPPADGPGPVDFPVTTLSAPGPEAECRELARECLRLAGDAVPFNAMAVLLRHPAAYFPLVAGALSRAGIPFCFRGAGLVPALPEARALLTLLEAVSEDFDRDLLFAALGMIDLDGSVYTAGDGPIPADRWDRITRSAGEPRGKEAILEALDALAKEAASEEEPKGETQRSSRTGTRSASVNACRAGLASLFGDLDAITGAGTFAEASRKLEVLIVNLFRESTERGVLLRRLDLLAEMDAAGEAVDPETLFRDVRDLLEDGAVSAGHTGRGGVNVLPVDQAAGLDFRAVLVPGLALRRFPAVPREDPILLDDERERLREDPAFACLALRAERLGEEARRFAAAVGSARQEIVLTYAGYDPAAGRTQAPSPFVLRIHEALEGKSLDLDALIEASVKTVPVFTGFNEREPSDTVQALDRFLTGGLAPKDRRTFLEKASPAYARAASRRRALLDDKAFSRFDGWLKTPGALQAVRKRFGDRRRFSPTALEEYALCPYKFFLRRVIRLSPLEDPSAAEEAEECDPLHKGAMVHEILEKVHRRIRKARQGGGTPDEASARRELERAADEVFGPEEEAGTVGSPAVWAGERAALLDLMWACLAEDLADMEAFQPVAFEKELEAAVVLPGKTGGPLSLVGYADRIDRSVDGRAVRVIDYKVTAGKVRKKDDSFQGGEALQLPLYLLLAFEGDPKADPDSSEGAYAFLSRKQGFRRVTFSGKGWQAKKRTLFKILGTVRDGIREGIFPQNPGKWLSHFKNFENCSFCEYLGICGKRRRARMGRLLKDLPRSPARLKRYKEMKEIGKV